MIRTLDRKLVEHAEWIAELARREGLDFFPTIFEMLEADDMTQVAAYGGFPQRYPHWRFGMDYERLRKQRTYGLSKIYEMVINTDPCYAYLLADNTITDHKTVIAHVYGHCDFFKHNSWFSKTDRRMMDEMANHATRVRRHVDRLGHEEVETFLDLCLSLENLIDPHAMFMQRPSAEEAEDDHGSIEESVTRFPAKRYLDRYINPPKRLEQERQRLREQKEQRGCFPAKPERDVLGFLLDYAPLEDWQADILDIVRSEAYYFAPQAQTKILNEGWASYWHSTLMTRYILDASELITYCDHHSGTLATGPGQLNPYKLGLELLRDIEFRWDTGRYGKDFEECTDIQVRREWGREKLREKPAVGLESPGRQKIFEVRRIFNDVNFVDEFLTTDFVDQQKLYHYRYDPATRRMVVVNRDFDKIKRQLLFSLTNHGQPYIYVVDANSRNRGELLLAHAYTGADLEIKFAVETLKNIEKIWGRPVHLQASIDGDVMMFTCEEGQVSEQRLPEQDRPQPAEEAQQTA